jgi:hypothetical protein
LASWAEFEASDPDLAAFGLSLLTRHGIGLGYLATARHDDGGPRVHPVCPFVGEGKLFIAIPRSSPKSADLRADPRYMLHAFPDEQDPEFSVRGRAQLVTEPSERDLAVRSVTFASGVRDDDDVFVLDIERADSTTWENWKQPDARPVRKHWIEDH